MSDTVFVVLFRGINVGGNKVVKMETLRAALAKAGFSSVATYIQSGNVVLVSDRKAADVAATIEQLFAETFGFASRPTVRSAEAWRALIAANPFPTGAGDPKSLHAVLLDGEPAPDATERLREKAMASERFALTDGVLYLFTPDGFGTSKLAGALDRTLGVSLTARNWRTVATLMEMADKAAAVTSRKST